MKAIDIHTHPPRELGSEIASYQRSMQSYFRLESSPPTPAEMANRDEVRSKILLENAKRLLGLA